MLVSSDERIRRKLRDGEKVDREMDRLGIPTTPDAHWAIAREAREREREEQERQRREMEAPLVAYLREHGPIPAARCSSASAKGRAKKYAYWGAAQYEIRVSKAGYPTAVCISGATSDRRSKRLAQEDTEELAERIGGVVIGSVGRLHPLDVDDVLAWLADRDVPINSQEQ